ncbi:MAG: SDR family oxidoreductase [Proteobacteria bacterium]|jgi:nucleoside-diphosphate-sugar epimerase|nr:SDR family oxidoreductase [Pseudomonadota bacterium]
MNPAVKDPSSVFIVGCGDIGQRVARLWQQRGVPVTGLARQTSALAEAGITPCQANLDEPASLQVLPVRDALVYYFAPPPSRGRTDTRMRHFLDALKPDCLPARIVAISTSGVYGDQQGNLVDETTPTRPQADRAHRRLDAEVQLREFGRQHNVAVIILRVGGIYGPGRLPIERLRQQVPMVHEHLAPLTNRIHAEDLAAVCLAAGRRGQADAIYNVSDGCHSNMTEYFNTVADFLGLPRPPAIDWEQAEQTLTPGMLSYLRESRRMDTTKMNEELGVKLRYPDLQQGLAACKE